MSASLKQSVSDLSELMRQRPELTDKSLVERGSECLAVFLDDNFGPSMPRFRESLRELYLTTILDIANNAPVLEGHTIGLAFKNGKFVQFSVPHKEPVNFGTVVCSINLKARKAFERHRHEAAIALEQDQINASIYLLTHRLSKL